MVKKTEMLFKRNKAAQFFSLSKKKKKKDEHLNISQNIKINDFFLQTLVLNIIQILHQMSSYENKNYFH